MCKFTCLRTRAVHIEILYVLDSDSLLIDLKRFFCRRGERKVILFDNGTNFVEAINWLENVQICGMARKDL